MKRGGFLAVMGLLLVPAFAFPQGQGSAAISGTVTDPSGAVIPGASVTVTQTSTGIQRRLATNSAGLFSAASLAPGGYSLSVRAKGFKTYVTTFTLLADQARSLAVSLQVGQATQTVTVEGTSVQVNTVSPVLSQVIETTRVMDLPLLGRNAADLTFLVPGAIAANGHGVQQGSTKQVPNGALAVAVNGVRPDQVAYNLDGGSNEDPMGNTNNSFPFPDALQEFSVQTNSFSSQYGANAGAVVNVVTKSGTNQWHGDGFEYLRNQAFNAGNWGTHVVNPLKQNEFGGTIGGPIKKDHSFIFFGFQRQTIRNVALKQQTTLPTPAEQKGDFSALCTEGFNASGVCNNPKHQIDSPYTGQPYKGNIITDPLDPVAINMLKFLPVSAENPTTGIAFFNGGRDVENDNQYVTRWDQVVRGQDRLTLRFYLDHYTNAPQYDGSNLLTLTTGSVVQSQNWLASYTWVPGPTFVNTTYFSVIRTASDRTQGGKVPQLSDLGANVPELPKALGGMRGFSVAGFFGFGNFTDGRFIRNTADWRDNATWIHGRHTIQFGGDYERDRAMARNTDFEDPSIGITSDVTGNAAASFMLGYLNSLQQSSGNYSDQVESPKGLYIADTWHYAPRLTFDMGLRYEPFTPEREIYGRFEQFLPNAWAAGFHSQRIPTAPAGVLFRGDCYQGYCVPSAGEGGDYDSFAPRVGFAYDVFGNHKTVVRGGAGVYYSTRLSTFFLNDPSIAPPFSLSINLSAGSLGPLSQPDEFQPVFVQNYPERYTLASVPANVQFPSLVRVWTLEPNRGWITPTTYDWNLTVEHELRPDTLLRVSYVGTRANHLREDLELNPAQYSLWVANKCTNFSGVCSTDARRPFPGFSNIYENSNGGNTFYNGLQITLEKRPMASSTGLLRRLTLLASYTWSKAMDDPLANGGGITDIGSAGDGGTSGLPYGDPATAAWDTGPSDYDHTHVLSVSYVWQLPTFSGSSKAALRWALGGWNWGGIYSFRTGNPLTIMAGADYSRTGLGLDRAVWVGSPSQYGGNGGGNGTACPAGLIPCVPYFNTSLFTTPAVGSAGNLGKDSFRGPSNWDYDMDLLKDFFPIAGHENLHFQVRADFSNFFNHPGLGDPYSSLNNASLFGRILGPANGERVVQLSGTVFF